MICSNCGLFNAAGSFCTSCGTALAATAAVAPAAATSAKLDSKKKIMIAGAVGVLVIGAVAFVSTRPSPAIPYLTEVCESLDPVESFSSEYDSDELTILLRTIKSDIDTSVDKDEVLGKPFLEIVPMMQNVVDDLADYESDSARYRLFDSTFALLSAIESLGDASEQSDELEALIDTICVPYLN